MYLKHHRYIFLGIFAPKCLLLGRLTTAQSPSCLCKLNLKLKTGSTKPTNFLFVCFPELPKFTFLHWVLYQLMMVMLKIFYRISNNIRRDNIERKIKIFLSYLLLLVSFYAFNLELSLLYPNNAISNIEKFR